MIEDAEIDTLRALADRIRGEAEGVTYGYFPGGDPREFTPDEECATADEMERYKADCAAWERGEAVDRGGPHVGINDRPDVQDAMEAARGTRPTVGWVTVSHYGLGTYCYRDESLMRLAQDLDDWIDRVRQVFG